ncbi:MAG: hypothetical protein PW788_12715 [Micavibrio sp.]|nr:hypothetical protein [Micavibrio sp.]
MSHKKEFNAFSRPPLESAKEARALLLSARAALFEMKRELADSKSHIKTVMNWDGDVNDAAAVKLAKADYTNRLKTHVIDSADQPATAALMKRMYSLYERMFPIEDEREDLNKLLRVLKDNNDPAKQSEGAPFRQQWIVVEDEKGDVVAARYISTFSAAQDAEVQASVHGTQHLTYSFVDPKHRSFGLGDHTMKVAEDEGRKFIAGTFGNALTPENVNLLQFCEQNAPLRMTPQALLEDTRGAKTDQFWRRDYYEKMGFREIQHNYTQVPLRADGESVDFLDLLVRSRPDADSTADKTKGLSSIAANTVSFHIYNTSKRSFAAGQYDVDSHPEWQKQSQDLAAKTQLTVRPRLDFNAMKDVVWNNIEKHVNSDTFNPAEFQSKTLGDIYNLQQIPPYTAGQDNNPKVTRLNVVK